VSCISMIGRLILMFELCTCRKGGPHEFEVGQTVQVGSGAGRPTITALVEERDAGGQLYLMAYLIDQRGAESRSESCRLTVVPE
jgi:hypothetical protein